MTTPCFNYSINSIIQRYKTLDALKFKRGLIEELKTVIFATQEPKMIETLQQVKALFFSVLRSPNYQRSNEYSLIQMNMIADAINHANISPTCINTNCSFCYPKAIQFPETTQTIECKKLYTCSTLNGIITLCVQELSKNIMESSITPIVLEMMMKISEYLIDEEKQECEMVIKQIVDILEENGWDGIGFSRAPNKQDICSRLRAIVYEQFSV